MEIKIIRNFATDCLGCLMITAVLLLLAGCRQEEVKAPTLFRTVLPDRSHVDFTNTIIGDAELNIFNYRNFFNGGGVAMGDINNDGFTDFYLISNMAENKLFLNKGHFEFQDITTSAGVGGTKAWSTGATFADVNGDGFLDIYVCNAGNREKDDRSNELFINNGDMTFTEQARDYGLNDSGFSTHAAFFDYDRDGDLDMYLLNNSFIPVGKLAYRNLRNQRDSLGGHKLFRNDGEHFIDVSEKAGIFGSVISFGLGITVGDFNEDNWLDIYISNDFYERDYLYVNNQDGTFKEDITEQMQHISLSSMGADAADVNNDGLLDIFVTDMLPGNDERMKIVSTFEGYDLYQLKKSRDYHNQIMQNTLQINNGDNTFSEVARFSGVHATDWSWGALLFDMDNDGLKDIFVANGIYKDVTDQDFVNFLVDEKNIKEFADGKRFDFSEFQNKIASRPLSNYAFRNLGNLKFVNLSREWGLDAPSFSNGSAYGDIDNDGDLDLIVNNANQQASIYQNTAVDSLKTHFVRIKLKGTRGNVHAIGAKVFLYQNGKAQYLQEMPNRGFQSSVDHTLIFGLGSGTTTVDSVKVIWPDDRMQTVMRVEIDHDLQLDHDQADKIWSAKTIKKQTPFERTSLPGLDYIHRENDYVDYYDNPLLKQMYSTQGPALAVGDVNGDGLEDVIFGSSRGHSMEMYLQRRDGSFVQQTPASFLADTASENIDVILFDADNDNDLDLYAVTGSNEFDGSDPALIDRYYENNGSGVFTTKERLPNIKGSGSCVVPADFDRDGDIDLFVGGRLIPGRYGLDAPSYLYVNDGSGNFKNFTRRYFSNEKFGMVTDAIWNDLDKDGYPELIVVGDWMPLKIFKNEKGAKFTEVQSEELKKSDGWWNCIEAVDLDNDGDDDFVLGNLGRNTRLKADSLHPVTLYVKDFDGNGAFEQIITAFSEDKKSYPIVLKHDLEKQLTFVKKRFIRYADYAGKGITEIFTPEELKDATVRNAFNSNSSMLINNGSMRFELHSLIPEAQYSPIMSVLPIDYDHDGKMDLVVGGNFFDVLPEIGQYDASYGLILHNKGGLQFEPVGPSQSGIFVTGQVRKMHLLRTPSGQNSVIMVRNNDSGLVFKTK